MKKLKYVLVVIFFIVIAILIYLYNSPSLSTDIVVEKIENNIAKETIYMKKISRGLSYEVIIITNDKSITENYDKEIVNTAGEPFFYKYHADTLFLYGGVWQNISDNPLKTTLIHKELENIDFINLKGSYKEKGLKIFPASYEKFLN